MPTIDPQTRKNIYSGAQRMVARVVALWLVALGILFVLGLMMGASWH